MLRVPCRLRSLVLLVGVLSVLGLYCREEVLLHKTWSHRPELGVAKATTVSTGEHSEPFQQRQDSSTEPTVHSSPPRVRQVPKWQTAATQVTRGFETRQTQPHQLSQGGYVLALDYWEQQTSASRNLQNLQCWAAQYNLSVVEPMMLRSVLRTPLTSSSTRHGFQFRDIFDIEMWNRLSSDSLHSQLVAWEDFLSSAPRDVILASFRHAFPVEIKQNLRKPQARTLPPSERVKEGCSTNWKSATQFLNQHHFNIVRHVCFNFAYGDKLTSKQFKLNLYGPLSPASSTVVFSQWRGSGPPARVLISDANCGNTGIQEVVRSSQRLLGAVEEYQRRYLGAGPYLAVIARMEKVQAYLKSKKGPHSLAECFSRLLSVWRDLRTQSGVNTTLLAIDMGKFGSNSIHEAGRGSELRTRFEEFFGSLYGAELTVEQWEDSFEQVARTEDPGYVAVMQKMLVVQAQCVVFIGGGSFQKHAQTLYLKSHHHTQPCVRIINECTPGKNLHRST